jgi:hypothetical protein
MTGRWLFVIALVVVTAISMHAQTPQPRIYSNVEFNKEGGDLLGMELQLSAKGDHLDGQLKIYQGGCAAPIAVTGLLTGNKLHLSGRSDEYGNIDLMGQFQGDVITGTIRIGNGYSEKLRLKRILKPHC